MVNVLEGQSSVSQSAPRSEGICKKLDCRHDTALLIYNFICYTNTYTFLQIDAIVPNSDAKTAVEDMLFESDQSEVSIGLEAQVGVPPSAWRWEAKLWRKFVYRGGWAEASSAGFEIWSVGLKLGHVLFSNPRLILVFWLNNF